MATDNLHTPGHAPYASSKAVLLVIKRLRDAGLPEPLTLEGLERVGVSSTMTSPVLRALRFLGLVDEGGDRLPGFERLRRAASPDYQSALAEVIRESYIKVFQIADPARDSYEQVHDAFRGFDPANQRPKMVRLFLGLCEEAGIVPPQPQRQRVPKKNPSGGRPASPQAPPPPQTAQIPQLPPPLRSTRYQVIDGIVAQLPANGTWSKPRRDRWLAAMTSAVDLLIETGDGEASEEEGGGMG